MSKVVIVASSEVQKDLKLASRLFVESDLCKAWDFPEDINTSNSMGWDVDGLRKLAEVGLANLYHRKDLDSELNFREIMEVFTLAHHNIHGCDLSKTAAELGVDAKGVEDILRLSDQARASLKRGY